MPRTDRRAIGRGENKRTRRAVARARTRRFLLPRMWRALARHRSLRRRLCLATVPTIGMAMRHILRTTVPIPRLPIDGCSGQPAVRRCKCVRLSHFDVMWSMRLAVTPISAMRQQQEHAEASRNRRRRGDCWPRRRSTPHFSSNSSIAVSFRRASTVAGMDVRQLDTSKNVAELGGI